MHGRATPLHELIRACLVTGQSAVWAELVNRLQPVFARISLRLLGASGQVRPQDVDDLVQSIFVKIGARSGELLRKVPLETEQTAESYLKALAANLVRDSLRGEYAQRRNRSHTQSINDLIEEIRPNRERLQAEQDVLLAELDRALEATSQERTVFWLYYRGGLTAKEIAALPTIELGPKGVESVIHRLTAALREAIGESTTTKTPYKLKGNTVSEAF